MIKTLIAAMLTFVASTAIAADTIGNVFPVKPANPVEWSLDQECNERLMMAEAIWPPRPVVCDATASVHIIRDDIALAKARLKEAANNNCDSLNWSDKPITNWSDEPATEWPGPTTKLTGWTENAWMVHENRLVLFVGNCMVDGFNPPPIAEPQPMPMPGD
jgi:hypothetical protein